MSRSFRSSTELEAGLAHIRRAPSDAGVIEMIVCRPGAGERQLLADAQLDVSEGLRGDNWRTRGSRSTSDGAAHPDMQLTLMSARAIALIAGSPDRWPLAGDQLYVDLDLSELNLPAGTRLALGEAEIELTAVPHTGCKKFAERFGVDAVKFVNSELGKPLHLRGRNARVIRSGRIAVNDHITKK